jgi:hypothetical protein
VSQRPYAKRFASTSTRADLEPPPAHAGVVPVSNVRTPIRQRRASCVVAWYRTRGLSRGAVTLGLTQGHSYCNHFCNPTWLQVASFGNLESIGWNRPPYLTCINVTGCHVVELPFNIEGLVRATEWGFKSPLPTLGLSWENGFLGSGYSHLVCDVAWRSAGLSMSAPARIAASSAPGTPSEAR